VCRWADFAGRLYCGTPKVACDFRHQVVRVTAKPEWRFTPKNWEERIVPLPTVLMERLRKQKDARGGTPNQLIFPNGRGKPDSETDVVVKRVAQRAGLNCKRCETEHGNKCAEGPYCMNFFLHKFRHTFATAHLRSGVDIRTVQAWLGHRDIKSTMVYLKGIQSKDAFARINAASLLHTLVDPRLEWKKPPLLVAFSNIRRFGDMRAAVTPKPMN
jgi:integrase/recombinase XerD